MEASFFHATRPLNCGSVFFGRAAYTAPRDPSAVTWLRNCSGVRVMMSTAPATPPSTRSAVALLRTITWLTSSEGSSEKLMLRPTVWTWSRTNQSPVATAWPLMSVCVRLGLVPRRLTRSFSSKPPEPPACELMVTPGTRCSESAMFLSGILPISSAVITSTTESALRLVSSDFSTEARIPVTVTVSITAGREVCCASAGRAVPARASATADAIGVCLNFIVIPPVGLIASANATVLPL